MILCYHGATSIRSDISTDISAAAQAGFKALELWADKIDEFLKQNSSEQLHQLLVDNMVKPATINAISFIGFRGEEFPVILERCHELCSIAKAIGCRTIVIVPSPTPKVDVNPGEGLSFPWDETVTEHVRTIRELCGIAASYGCRLAFEFLCFPWCSVRTLRGAYEIIQQAAVDNIGLVLDACHFYGGGSELGELNAIDPQRIFSFHLNDVEDGPKEAITDSRRLLPGLGCLPLQDICSSLKKIGYDGFCSIELFRPEYWNWDPFELASRARQAAVKVLEPFFKVE